MESNGKQWKGRDGQEWTGMDKTGRESHRMDRRGNRKEIYISKGIEYKFNQNNEKIWNGKDMKLNLKEMERNHAASKLLTWTIAKGALFRPGLVLGTSSYEWKGMIMSGKKDGQD